MTKTDRDTRADDAKIARLIGWVGDYEGLARFHTWQHGDLCLEYAQREWRDTGDEKWKRFRAELWQMRYARGVREEDSAGYTVGYEAEDDYAVAFLAAAWGQKQ